MKVAVTEPKSLSHPTRTSSLPHRAANNAELSVSLNQPSGQSAFEQGRVTEDSNRHKDSSPRGQLTGLEDLAAYRAELYLLQRRMLETVGKSSNWSAGWSAITRSGFLDDVFSEVDLSKESNGSIAQSPAESRPETPSLTGLCSDVLRKAVSSLTSFRRLYEVL